MEYILNPKKIEEGINSRQWQSSAGIDGLDYAIYKLETKESAVVIQ